MVLFEVSGQHNPALREGTLLCVRFQRVEDVQNCERWIDYSDSNDCAFF